MSPARVAAQLGLPLPANNQRLTWAQVLDMCVAAYWRRRHGVES
jgi:hypothetical protein